MKFPAFGKRWRIVLSVALLAVVLWHVDALDELGRVSADASPSFLLLAVAIMTLDRLLMSFKWILLLESRGVRLPLYEAFKIYCASMVWGMFLPSTVGADALRAYLTSRSGLDGYEVTASIIVERVVGFVAALLFGLLGLILLSGAGILDERFGAAWWGGSAALALALGAILLSFREDVFEALLRFAPARLRSGRVAAKFRQFHEAYRGYGSEGHALGVFFALTLLEQGLAVVGAWTVAISLHVDVPLWFMAGVMPLSMLIARLPITFDGIGLFEGTFALLMSLGGVGVAQSLSVALWGRLLQTLAWTPWWFLYSIGHKDVRPPKQPAPS